VGSPIAGVTVTVHYWGTGAGENPHLRANIDAETTSDKEGRWQVDVMPREIAEDKLRIFVSHPDYVSDHLKRAITPYPVTERPRIDTLYDRTAVMVRKKGESITGSVVDSEYRPLADVKMYDSDYYWMEPGKPTATSDEKGEFRISGVLPGPLYLTAESPGFAPELVDVWSMPMPLKIQLKPGKTVQGRVVGEDGKPIEGVSVTAQRWRQQDHRIDLRAKTDAKGCFRLTDAPTDEVQYDLGKNGYMMAEQVSMSASSKEHSITLK
jgi:hypothetical protein